MPPSRLPRPDLSDTLDAVLDAAFFAQATLGPRASEREYRDALAVELDARRVPHRRDVAFPVMYEGMEIPNAFVVDFLVAESLVVLARGHGRAAHSRAHLETYLRHSRLPAGLAVDFSAIPLERGLAAVYRVEPDDSTAASAEHGVRP